MNLPQEVQPGLLGSAPGTSGYNPAWFAAATIFVDPQATVPGASDANDGLTAATPIVHWAEAVRRYGANAIAPSTSQNVTFLSSHTDGTDPVIFKVTPTGGAVWTMQGAAPAITAAVFTLNATKSRAAGSNRMVSGSFSAGAPAAGVLLQNTTAGKSSRCMVHSSAGGANWNLTQPFAPLSVPSATDAPAEVDTWASTDTVNVLAPIKINIVSLEAGLGDANGAGDNFVYLYQCRVFDPSGVGVDPCTIRGVVQVQEVVFERGVNYSGDSATQASIAMVSSPSFVNCYYLGGFFCIGGGNYFSLVGGGTNSFTNIQGNATIDGDYVAGGFGCTLAGSLTIGLLFYDSNVTLVGGQIAFATALYGSHVLYGTTGKSVTLKGTSRGTMASGTYAAGWTQATLIATGVLLNGTATGQTHTNATPDVVTSNVATTVANADAAAGGVMTNFGGASISKAA